MEVRCPSCGSRHRSEDYPGAFDILCSCGYLILNPEESGGASESNEINFEGPAASEEMSDDEKVISIQKTDEFGENQNEASSHFSTDSMTPPEELPDGMIYDPFEIPSEEANAQESTSQQNTDLKFTEETKSATSLSNLTQEFIQRIQKGSVGQILGPDYDLEIHELPHENKLKARERVEKFLADQKWLREEMEKRSFILENLFNTEKIENVPEPLAVEIYIACLENQGRCLFTRHNSPDVSH